MSMRSKVVIESNLKPSQFGRPADERNDDFDAVYESPLDMAKPFPPPNVRISSALHAGTSELPRHEPETMEFANAKTSRDSTNGTGTEELDLERTNEYFATDIVNGHQQQRKRVSRNSANGQTNDGFDRGCEELGVAYRGQSENLVTVESQDYSLKMPPDNRGNAEDKPDISFQSVAASIIKSLDANRYATKKTIAQGMLDIALLTANASQLKYILQVGKQHEFYILMLSLICVSIGLQAVVGVLYVIVGRLNINKPHNHRSASIINDLILIAVFFISLTNVIMSGFGMDHSNRPLPELNCSPQETLAEKAGNGKQ